MIALLRQGTVGSFARLSAGGTSRSCRVHAANSWRYPQVIEASGV